MITAPLSKVRTHIRKVVMHRRNKIRQNCLRAPYKFGLRFVEFPKLMIAMIIFRQER